MATTLRIDNYTSVNQGELGEIDADAAVGVSTLTFKSVAQYQANDIVIVGRLGSEGSEKLIIQSVVSSTKVVTFTTPTTQPHKRFEIVTALKGDQIKLYRASNVDGNVPADGSFSLLGTSTNIDIDQLFTDITDTNGSSSYWYKYTFYNSIAATETSIADSRAARGSGYGHYVTIDSIRLSAGFLKNKNITDPVISEYRDAAESEINGALTGRYVLPFPSPVNPYITNIAKLLAAGLLMGDMYAGTWMGDASSKPGMDKVNEAREMLMKLKAGTDVITDAVLVDSSITSGAEGYPNAAPIADPVPDEAPRMFRIADRY